MTEKTQDGAQMAPATAPEVSGALLGEGDRARLVELSEQREAMYGLLSRLYLVEVDAELYASLCGAAFPTGTGNADVDAGYRLVATYCARQHDDALLDLARDYARVFIGHGNNAYAAAYPFESVYTSEKRLLMQEARDEIIEVYRQAGLEIGPEWHDPEDHIALELAYMQVMAGRTREALQACEDERALRLLDDQRRFLLRHLVSWTPLLVKDMRRLAKTDLYQGLALLTKGLLAQDREFLCSVVSEGEGDPADAGAGAEAAEGDSANADGAAGDGEAEPCPAGGVGGAGHDR